MFTDHAGAPVRRMSFFSVALICGTAVLITLLVSATGVVVYGLRIVDSKADNIGELVNDTLKSLPEIRESLPPALSDAINDVRRPDYLAQLDIKTRLGESQDLRHGKKFRRVFVDITNNGDQVVSLMTMRVMGLDENGEAIECWSTYPATPLQLDNDWRGPLLPKETRKYSFRHVSDDGEEIVKVDTEVTEVRVWKGAEDNAAPAKQLTASSRSPSL
jgi:hypothetical protein